jgi:Ca2+-binding EF-hand superfamily protein
VRRFSLGDPPPGTIDCAELKAAMQSLGFEVKNRTIYSMIADIAKENEGKIDFETFLNLMVEKMKNMGDSTVPGKVSS